MAAAENSATTTRRSGRSTRLSAVAMRFFIFFSHSSTSATCAADRTWVKSTLFAAHVPSPPSTCTSGSWMSRMKKRASGADSFRQKYSPGNVGTHITFPGTPGHRTRGRITLWRDQ